MIDRGCYPLGRGHVETTVKILHQLSFDMQLRVTGHVLRLLIGIEKHIRFEPDFGLDQVDAGFLVGGILGLTSSRRFVSQNGSRRIVEGASQLIDLSNAASQFVFQASGATSISVWHVAPFLSCACFQFPR